MSQESPKSWLIATSSRLKAPRVPDMNDLTMSGHLGLVEALLIGFPRPGGDLLGQRRKLSRTPQAARGRNARALLVEDFGGGLPAKSFAGLVVHGAGHGGELPGRPAGQVRCLRGSTGAAVRWRSRLSVAARDSEGRRETWRAGLDSELSAISDSHAAVGSLTDRTRAFVRAASKRLNAPSQVSGPVSDRVLNVQRWYDRLPL